tara:strand:+ start:6558 stop:6818 length:261 start_codon:yes stop_codon:yes gene_type:complete
MLEIRTKSKVINTHYIASEFTLDELEEIQTALYETDKTSDLLQKVGDVVHRAQSRIENLKASEKRNVTQDEVIQAQSGACTTGNCD